MAGYKSPSPNGTEGKEGFLTPSTTDGGMTQLHWAAYLGKLEEVRQLLRVGADFSTPAVLKNQLKQTVVGVTPLYLAAQQGHIDVVRLLLALGADLSQKCGVPSTGEAFGPEDIALIRLHFKTWWILSQQNSKSFAARFKHLTSTRRSKGFWHLKELGSPRMGQPLL